MYYFLLVILILVSVVLVGAILLQSGKGGGLAASFGGASSSTDSFIGTRQAGNLLTKMSWWGGGVFLTLAFVLQILSLRTQVPRSVLEQGLVPPPPATAPTGGAAPALPLGPGAGTQAAPAAPVTPPPQP